MRRTADGGPAWLYVLLKHQSTPDRWLRLRLLKYSIRIWERDRRRHPNEERLRPIVPPIAAGSLSRNAFGLYDVHGNVTELVADCYDAGSGAACTRRIVRGGSWGSRPELVRSAYRSWCAPTLRNLHNGFRVARTLSSKMSECSPQISSLCYT